jgi:opacity protein-like surface antigen
VRTPATDLETPFAFRGRPTSFTAGGFIGYNVNLSDVGKAPRSVTGSGDIVIGVEGDFAVKDGNTRRTLPAQATGTYYPASAGFSGAPAVLAQRSEVLAGSTGQGWDSSVRLRAGMLVTPWVLLYATGGIAFGEVHGSFSYSATTPYLVPPTAPALVTPVATPGSVLLTDSVSGGRRWREVRVGWTAGGGAEMVLFDGWKLRIEYRYADLGTYSKDLPLVRACTPGVLSCSVPNVGSTNAHLDLKDDFHTVRIGIGYTF